MSKEIVPLLERTNELLTILAKSQLSSVLEKELADPKHRDLYDLTGANLPITEIAKRVGISTGKISGIWKRWELAGLVIKDGKQYRKVFQ